MDLWVSQNLFSADDIATTQIQPILACTFSKKVSVALGDLQYTYDWKKDRWVFLPLGFQINYIARLVKQAMRFFVNRNTTSRTSLVRRNGRSLWGSRSSPDRPPRNPHSAYMKFLSVNT